MAIIMNFSPDKTSLRLQSNWSYTYASVSGNTYTYRKNSGPSSASNSVSFDLSAIPTNAVITSAKLTWTYSNSLNTGGLSVGPTGGDYARVGIADSGYTVNLNSSGSDFKNYITLGATNKFNFSYYPSSVKSTVTTNVQASNISCSSTLTISNIALSVTYEEPYSAPSAPTTVTLSANNVAPGASVTLSWSGAKAGTNNAITGYHIYRATSSSGTYSHTYSVTTSSTSGSVAVTAPSTNGSSYYFKVCTIGTVSGYNSEASSAVSLTCIYSAPSAPTEVYFDTTLTHGSATLTWKGAYSGINNEIVNYQVQLSESSDGITWGDWSLYTTTSSSVQSCSIASPSTYNNYYKCRVRALGSLEESNYSLWKESVNRLRRDHEPIGEFTDALVQNETPIKAVHMTELQDAINMLLDFYGLNEQTMTNIVAGTTSLGGWTNHVNEIKSAIDILTTYHDDWLEIPVNCPRADVMQQLRDVIIYVEKPKAVLGIAKLGATVV